MGLSRDLSRCAHAELGIRLVESVLASEEVQNVRLNQGHSKTDLNVYHSNESCAVSVSKLVNLRSHGLHAHSSSFRNVRLPRAGK